MTSLKIDKALFAFLQVVVTAGTGIAVAVVSTYLPGPLGVTVVMAVGSVSAAGVTYLATEGAAAPNP